MRALPIVTAIGLSGCMLIDHLSPQHRLADVVHGLNDEVRWGRIDLAAQRVGAAHRAEFVARHRNWGHGIQIADVDVTNLELGLSEGRAASLVTYSWIDERTMELHATRVRQIWQGEGDGFMLVSEEIVGGEPDLLAGAPIAVGTWGASPREAVESSGGESLPVTSVPSRSTDDVSLFAD